MTNEITTTNPSDRPDRVDRRVDEPAEHDHDIRTEAGLTAFVRDKLCGMLREQVWVLFIAEDGTFPLVSPIDDVPDPGDDRLHLLAPFIEQVLDLVGGVSVAIAWERAGSGRLAPADVGRAQIVARTLAERGVPLREQYVVHDDGVRRLRKGEYA